MQCDCGFDFDTGVVKPSLVLSAEVKKHGEATVLNASRRNFVVGQVLVGIVVVMSLVVGAVVPGIIGVGTMAILAFWQFAFRRAVKFAAHGMNCPNCGALYDPSDYEIDAVQILCTACKAELPRPTPNAAAAGR
jgi:hypothetical protein